MNTIILEMLRSYLIGDFDFDSLEDRVIVLAWEADGEDSHLVDQIAVEIAYVKDEVSDEATFKARVAEIAVPKPDIMFMLWDAYAGGNLHTTTRTGGDNTNRRLTYREPVAAVDHHLVVRFG